MSHNVAVFFQDGAMQEFHRVRHWDLDQPNILRLIHMKGTVHLIPIANNIKWWGVRQDERS